MFANSFKRTQQFSECILRSHMDAQMRAASVGRENVIDGTVGALTQNGELVTFPSVDRLIPQLDIKKISAYTPIQGIGPFLDAMETLCFDSYKPARKIGRIAVAGGNSGIHHAVCNYTEPRDIVLTSDWYWSSYEPIVKEHGRRLGLFTLFQERRFSQESFEESVNSLARLQESIFIILNTPGHNPTGYTISLDEWGRIVRYLNSLKRRIILCIDAAYIDYAPPEYRKMFSKLNRLGDNTLVIVVYSISKSLAKYGLRTAALFALHRDRNVIKEFERVLSITNQATHACPPSLGQYLTAALVSSDQALADYYTAKQTVIERLAERAAVFADAVDEYLLTPYRHGFFVSIRTERGEALVETLRGENIFLVPVYGGVRVALCSLEKEQLRKLGRAVMQYI